MLGMASSTSPLLTHSLLILVRFQPVLLFFENFDDHSCVQVSGKSSCLLLFERVETCFHVVPAKSVCPFRDGAHGVCIAL